MQLGCPPCYHLIRVGLTNDPGFLCVAIADVGLSAVSCGGAPFDVGCLLINGLRGGAVSVPRALGFSCALGFCTFNFARFAQRPQWLQDLRRKRRQGCAF